MKSIERATNEREAQAHTTKRQCTKTMSAHQPKRPHELTDEQLEVVCIREAIRDAINENVDLASAAKKLAAEFHSSKFPSKSRGATNAAIKNIGNKVELSLRTLYRWRSDRSHSIGRAYVEDVVRGLEDDLFDTASEFFSIAQELMDRRHQLRLIAEQAEDRRLFKPKLFPHMRIEDVRQVQLARKARGLRQIGQHIREASPRYQP